MTLVVEPGVGSQEEERELPTEKRRNFRNRAEYLDWLSTTTWEHWSQWEQETNSEEMESVEDEDKELPDSLAWAVEAVISPTFETPQMTAIHQITVWIEAGRNKSARERTVEEYLVSVMGDKATCNLPLMATIAALNRYRESQLVSEEILKRLDLDGGFTQKLQEDLNRLSASTDVSSTLLARSIWEFASQYRKSYARHVLHPLLGEPVYSSDYKSRGSSLLWKLVTATNQPARSYLTESAHEDFLSVYENDEVGSGIEEDEDYPRYANIIPTEEGQYVLRHVGESYENRIALGVDQGLPTSDPVFSIAPGLYAQYRNGQVIKVFTLDEVIAEGNRVRSQELIQDNEPQDAIAVPMDKINHPLPIPGDRDTGRFRQLETVESFITNVEDNGRHFFFDVDTIDRSVSHFMVQADVYNRNTHYLHRVKNPLIEQDSLTNEEMVRRIGFVRTADESDLTAYYQMMSLPMRQRIEHDFGLDIATFDLWVQQAFLRYLEGQDLESVERLQGYTYNFGVEGLVAFLTVESDPDANRETLERFMEATRIMRTKDSRVVLQKISFLVKKAEGVRSWLGQHMGDLLETNPDLAERVVAGLLTKGRAVLQLVDQVDRETLLVRLEEVDADLSLTVNAFYTLTKAGVEVNLERFPGVKVSQISGGSIPPEVGQMLTAVAERNWQSRPHMSKKVLDSMREAFDNPNSTFYLIQQEGQIIGFFRLDKTGEGEMEFGSMNISAEARGYALAHGILENVLKPEMDGQLVTAYCDPWAPVTEQYLATGFVATGLEDYADTGQPAFEIRYDGTEVTPHYKLAGLSYDDLLEQAKGSQQIVQYSFSKDPVRSPGDRENERFMADIRRRVNDGSEVITNLRFGSVNPEDGSRPVLVAFEPAPSSSQRGPGASSPDTDPQ